MLAFAALAVSVLGCCPLLSAIGSTMGLLAVRRITHANGALRGRRIAHAAVLVGVCATISGAITWSRVLTGIRTWTDDAAVAAVEKFVRAAEAADAMGAREAWAAGSVNHLDDAVIIGFGDQAVRRYGAFRSFRVTSAVPGQTTIPATLEYAGTFAFDRAELTGAAGFVLEPTSTWSHPYNLRLQTIKIDDRSLGDLMLPPAKPASTTSPASTAPDTRTTNSASP